jgi:heme/copper-type cytochrome/quinol oxidase subunit 2
MTDSIEIRGLLQSALWHTSPNALSSASKECLCIGSTCKWFCWPLLGDHGLSSSTARAETAPQRIEITAKRFAFEPGEITLKKGQPVVLVLKSADVAHGHSYS